MNSLTCTDSKNNNHDFTTKVELDMVKGQAKQDFYRNRALFIRMIGYKNKFVQHSQLKYHQTNCTNLGLYSNDSCDCNFVLVKQFNLKMNPMLRYKT